jgi:ABC-2 type transport system ATP-binding protein
MNSNPLLSFQDVSKSFGEIHAVESLSLQIHAGECVGLLGPNGAGKTTAISMASGLFPPDRGEITLRGESIRSDTAQAKRLLGVVPQDLALYEELKAVDNLRFFGALYQLSGAALKKAMDHALDFAGLSDRRSDLVKHFSGGMKRRLNLAAALLHDPEILLLDEPTVGVDPQSRNAIFESIADLRQRGKTIIYTTHYMEEVERLCDRVIIIDHGRLIADNSVERLKQQAAQGPRLSIELCEPMDEASLAALAKISGVLSARASSRRLSVDVSDLQPGTVAVLDFLHQSGRKWMHLNSERPNLESVFLSLTGSKLRDL